MSFLRRFSFTQNDENDDIKNAAASTASADNGGSSFFTGLGTTKLLDSVNATTTSLAGGFTNKFDQLKKFASQDLTGATNEPGSNDCSNPPEKEKGPPTNTGIEKSQNAAVNSSSKPTPLPKPNDVNNEDHAKPAVVSSHPSRNTNPFATDAPIPPSTNSPNLHSTVPGQVAGSRPRPPKPPPPKVTRQNTNPFVSNAPPRSMREAGYLDRTNSVDSTNPLAEVLEQGISSVAVSSHTDVSELTRRECEKIVTQMGQWMSLDESTIMDDGQDLVKQFVRKLLERQPISQEEKSKFGELCQKQSYRKWFAKVLDKQNLGASPINEVVFYTLVQFFAVVLFECHEAKDYEPAKELMNLSFQIYAEVQSGISPRGPVYLYNFLKDQPVWQSPKFWESAFLNSIQEERLLQTRAGNTKREAIPFIQLKKYIGYMTSFSINKVMCHDFLRKQTILLTISEDEIESLRKQIDCA